MIASVNAIDELVEDLNGNANTTELTLVELKDIQGVTGIIDASMADYNAAFVAAPSPFADTNNPTISEINAVIASVNAINELVEDLNGNANTTVLTLAELKDIQGLIAIIDASMADYSAAFVAAPSPFADTNNPTISEINAVIVSVNNIVSIAELVEDLNGDSNTTVLTLVQLKNIQGVVAIIDASMAAYNAAFVDAPSPFADINNPTVSEVNAVIVSVNAINELVEDLNGNTNLNVLALAQLEDIQGILRIVDANMTDYNAAFIASPSPFADINNPTLVETQAVIDSVNTIIANETAALDELIEDIAGNGNSDLVDASELNTIRGVSGALIANQAAYQAAFITTTPSPFSDSSNPTAAEIQAVIMAVNSAGSDNGNGGLPDVPDNDNDGISDSDEDPNLDNDNDPATSPRDTDGDGIPDYLDDDSDNDGKKDSDERDDPYDANNPRDTDGDGIPDVIDADDSGINSSGDSDNDTIPDSVECSSQPCRDTDADGVPDFTDTDSDNDGLLDADEVGNISGQLKDTDGDGIPDIADPTTGGAGENGGDSDDDGVSDAEECNSWPDCADSDNDGLADYLDNDLPKVVLGKIKTGVHGAGSIHWAFTLMLALMVMFRRKSAVVIAVLILSTSWSASAEWWNEMDVYVGAGLGQSHLAPSLGGSGYSIDDHTQNAWKLTAGWDLNDHLSIEGYYSDLGRVKLDPSAKIGYRMMGGDAMLHYWAYGDERKKGSVALYVKAGLNHMTNNGNRVSYEKNNTMQLFGGVGVELYLRRKFSVRFEIESYDSDAALLSLNLVKRFGFKSKKVVQKKIIAVAEPLPEKTVLIPVVLLPVVLDSDLDGLLDNEDQCPNTPKGMTVDEFGCAKMNAKMNALITKLQFESNSAVLTEPSKMALNEIASMLLKYVDTQVEVQAHSDNTGPSDYNKKLSQKRADAVVQYLEKQSIDRSRLEPLGFGEDKPIAVNNTKAGRAKNRRVEFILK